MIYIHSFSTIEQNIHRAISNTGNVVQVDCKNIISVNNLERSQTYHPKDTLIYSFLSIEFFQNIDTFMRELSIVDIIVNFAKSNKYKRLVVITYPGAYLNSDNLYLQYRGLIEKKFMDSGIPASFLCVQGIYHPYMKFHNFHGLFFDKYEGKYIIPQKSNIVIYSVAIDTLSSYIAEACAGKHDGFFDVFDTVQSLPVFLETNSREIKIQRVLPIYLYFKSFIGKSLSVSMLELFLRPTVAMFNYRTERIFGIKLSKKEPSIVSENESPNHTYKVPPIFGTQGFHLSH